MSTLRNSLKFKVGAYLMTVLTIAVFIFAMMVVHNNREELLQQARLLEEQLPVLVGAVMDDGAGLRRQDLGGNLRRAGRKEHSLHGSCVLIRWGRPRTVSGRWAVASPPVLSRRRRAAVRPRPRHRFRTGSALHCGGWEVNPTTRRRPVSADRRILGPVAVRQQGAFLVVEEIGRGVDHQRAGYRCLRAVRGAPEYRPESGGGGDSSVGSPLIFFQRSV